MLQSVQFSRWVMSNSLWPHGLQHARFPCPSPTPGVYSNSCPLSQWHHQTISSSVVPFSCLLLVFSNESVLRIGWPKYLSFNFSISPSNEYSRLISFRMDWLDLLAVQGTLKSLLQHHSSKASILQCSAFFIVQLSHPYMTIGKTIDLTRQTFVGKLMSLLFNMLPRLETMETMLLMLQFSSVQSLTRVRLFVTPWITARQASLSITNSTNSRSLLKLMSIESMMPSSHLILCCPLFLLPPIPPRIRVFSNELVLWITWTRIGVSTSASVLPKNTQGWFLLELTGLISWQSKGAVSSITIWKYQFSGTQFLL